MTREAFIQAKNRYAYGVGLPGTVLLAAMVVLPLVWYAIQDNHRDLPLIERIAGHAVCVGVLVFGLWFNFVYSWRVYDRLQYWCPNCREGFGGYENEVLQTGKCHYCGLQVIDAAEQRVPPEPAGS
jgi:DNA-directed RNA polymerase subunit RPC12/RpoP